jgi:N-hydroxyarylamine O-acetyltransferase
MQLQAYLDRIGFDGVIRHDLETLTALHRAHLMSVPYENLDVQLKRPVSTDAAHCYDKVVARRRGGWCYEMNGVFAWALQAAGFEVTRHCGNGDETGSHLVLEVRLDRPYVCDVGFGEGAVEPFALEEGTFFQRGFEFRLERLEHGWRFHNHRFGLVPGFDFAGPDEAALAERCDALQTEPGSVFVQNAILLKHDAEGYTTILGREMRRITAEGRSKRVIEDVDAYLHTLQTVFGLDVPEARSLWPAICRRHEEIAAQRAAAAESAGGKAVASP